MYQRLSLENAIQFYEAIDKGMVNSLLGKSLFKRVLSALTLH